MSLLPYQIQYKILLIQALSNAVLNLAHLFYEVKRCR